jgi:hypothetical protein
VFWPEGSAGRRDFTLTLLAAPSHSILSASLANPSARAVLQPLAAVANIMVDSPVVSFTTNLVRKGSAAVFPALLHLRGCVLCAHCWLFMQVSG